MKTLTNKNRQSNVAPALPLEFRFLKALGSGGTSEVALVKRESDGRKLAYKYSPFYQTTFNDSSAASAENSEHLESFRKVVLRELKLAKNLNHPCVTPVSLIDRAQPQAGLLMPLITGQALIETPMPVNPELLREILSSLSMALYYLELKSVIHGDIKPHNVFLPEEVLSGDYDFSKLFFPRFIDFSMGMENGEAPDNRLGIGTLGYSAPETFFNGSSNGSSSGAMTYQSDIFSLGVIAYYLATGKHPFLEADDDPAKISSAVTEFSPVKLDKAIGGFPKDLAKLIDSMLAKEPALRPKNGFVICKSLQSQGAKYPFCKAIAPRHLLMQGRDQDIETLSTLPGFDLPDRNRLHRISSGDLRKVRLILDATFRSRKLLWIDGVICAAQGFHKYVWPERLLRSERKAFSGLTLVEAKWIVRCAVAGNVADLVQIIEAPAGLRFGIANSSLVETVRGDLSGTTIKRQSKLLASKLLERPLANRNIELLAKLQLQAHQVEACAQSAFKYCDELKVDNRQIEALSLLGKIAKLAEKLNENEILIETLHRDAFIRHDSGDMNGAEERYKRIVELSGSRKTRTLAATYKDLGDLYKLKQDYKAGLEALGNAESLYSEFGETADLARVTNNMGNIYWIISEYQWALNSYRRALRLHRKRGDLTDISSTVNNIASIYAVTGRLGRAIWIYSLSLSMKRKLGNRPEIARTLNNLGYTYYLQGKLALALEVLEEALQINEVESSKKEIITNLDNFVACAITAGRFADAISHIRRGREISEELHDSHSKAIFDASLASVLTHTGSWDQALRLTDRSASAAAELSDKVLQIRCLLLQAELYGQMQFDEKHRRCIDQATRFSEEIGDKQALIQCILTDKSSQAKRLEFALEMALGSKSPRDSALCQLALAESHLDSNASAEASGYMAQATNFFANAEEDIEHPRFWRLWAEMQMKDSSISSETLKDIFSKLLDVDTKVCSQGERFHSWKLQIVIAEVGSKCVEYEQSYASLMRAMKTIRELANVLPDKSLVKAFTLQRFMSRMSVEIVNLKSKLNVS